MKKRNFIVFLGLILVGFLGWNLIKENRFNENKILKNSILAKKEFSSEVEVISDRKKKIEAYYMKDDSVNLVFMNFGFDRMGRAYEPKEGIGLLMKVCLLDGAGEWNREELRKLMKEKGIKIGVDVNRDNVDFSFSYVKDFENEAFKVLKAVLFEPRLDEKDVALSKEQLKMVKKRSEENPQTKLNKLVLKEFFVEHPYGKDVYPSDEKLDDIKIEDIRKYLKEYMTKDVLSIGIVGNIEKNRVEEFLDEVFGELVEKSKSEKLEEFKACYEGEKKSVELNQSRQSFVRFIGKGIRQKEEDFYPFYIADFILGGAGLNSRLNKVVREKEGLSYGIYSFLTEDDAVSLWNISYSATPENAEKIEKIVEDEYNRFLKNGVSEEEVLMAKKSLLASFNLRFSSLASISYQLQRLKRDGLGFDFFNRRQKLVEKVSVDDVNRVIYGRMPKVMRIFEGKGK